MVVSMKFETGKDVLAYRKKRQISQETFADLIDMRARTISRVECENKKLSREFKTKLELYKHKL